MQLVKTAVKTFTLLHNYVPSILCSFPSQSNTVKVFCGCIWASEPNLLILNCHIWKQSSKQLKSLFIPSPPKKKKSVHLEGKYCRTSGKWWIRMRNNLLKVTKCLKGEKQLPFLLPEHEHGDKKWKLSLGAHLNLVKQDIGRQGSISARSFLDTPKQHCA